MFSCCLIIPVCLYVNPTVGRLERLECPHFPASSPRSASNTQSPIFWRTTLGISRAFLFPRPCARTFSHPVDEVLRLPVSRVAFSDIFLFPLHPLLFVVYSSGFLFNYSRDNLLVIPHVLSRYAATRVTMGHRGHLCPLIFERALPYLVVCSLSECICVILGSLSHHLPRLAAKRHAPSNSPFAGARS